MASGRETLRDIEDAIGDIRTKERTLQGELESATRQRADLMNERTNAFRELATVRAKNAIADGIIDRADRLSHRVENILSARQKTIDDLKLRLSAANESYEEKLLNARSIRDDIAGLEEELDAFATKAREILDSDPGHLAQKANTEKLTGMLDKAKKKAEQTRQDRERKGRDYENDVLFMYLWNRGYGKESYKPHALIRWLDDKVAHLVRYSEARANYAILREIPRRLAEHVESLREKLEIAEKNLDETLSEITKEVAGHEFLAKLETARATEHQINKEIEQLGAEISEISALLNRYAQGADPSFRKAVDMSANFLEQTSVERLSRLARATPEPTDDQIVARISHIEAKREDLVEEIERKRADLENLARRREELIRVAADFRRSHYDTPGSVFVPDDDLGYILEELVKGAITGAEYWARAQRRHRRSARSGDPWRRSAGLPPFGGSDFGRTWGSGADFRTGGGF